MEVTTPDGRTVFARVDGDPRRPVLVYQPGTPHAPTPEVELVAAAAARGLCLLTVARPGYPGSTPRPGRTVADAAADVRAVLAAAGTTEHVALGWSGGGPHALACAALLDGCRAAALVAGIGPPDADGLDLLAGMADDNVEEMLAARAGAGQLERWLQAGAIALRGVTGADLVAQLGGLLPPADRAALTPDRAEQTAAALAGALRDGLAGWRDDDLAFVRPWGFDVGAVDRPVGVWQGAEDLMVPLAHGRWLASAIPGARAHLLSAEGHLSIGLDRTAEIVDELVELAGW